MSRALHYSAMRGMGDLPGDSSHPNSPDYDDSRDEAIGELLQDRDWCRAHEAKAEEWTAGTFTGEHYTEVTLALNALHVEGMTDDVMARLHRLAKVESEALTSKLSDIAEAAVDCTIACESALQAWRAAA